MKRITALIIFLIAAIGTKAQTPKIVVSYDGNGNRILRQYLPARPAPPVDPTTTPSDSSKKVEGLAAINCSVYPNPSEDLFNLSVDPSIMAMPNTEVVLLDQLGRVHFRKKISGTLTTISTKGMADGIYSIILNYGSNKQMFKIVKKTN